MRDWTVTGVPTCALPTSAAPGAKPVPTITGFAPGAAAPGSPVMVDGTGFGGGSAVKLHGVSAGFSVLSRTQDRKSVVEGKSVDLGGRRIIKKKSARRGRPHLPAPVIGAVRPRALRVT